MEIITLSKTGASAAMSCGTLASYDGGASAGGALAGPSHDLRLLSSADSRCVLTNVTLMFSCKPTDLSASLLEDALSKLQVAEFAPPSGVGYSEAVHSRLLPVSDVLSDSSFNYTERSFLQMSTDRNWTQNEAKEVLHMLLRPEFDLSELQPDILRRVSISTYFHIVSTYFHFCVLIL